MGSDALSENAIQRLTTRVLRELALCPLDGPLPAENEVTFSRRVLKPALIRTLSALGIRELTVVGGAPAPIPVTFWGFDYYPDLTIMRFVERILALEVKYAVSGQAVATAIGQAAIYQASGYRRSAALIISREAVAAISERFHAKSSPPAVCRVARDGLLLPDVGFELEAR